MRRPIFPLGAITDVLERRRRRKAWLAAPVTLGIDPLPCGCSTIVRARHVAADPTSPPITHIESVETVRCARHDWTDADADRSTP